MTEFNSRGLRRLLLAMNALVSLLCVNAIYLLVARAGWLGPLTGNPGREFQWMFLAHLALGVLLIPVFVAYLGGHARRGWASNNVRARRAGILLGLAAAVVMLSGLLLTRGIPWFELRAPGVRAVYYWLHVIVPLAVLALAFLHRRAGTGINWRMPVAMTLFAGLVAATFLHLAEGPAPVVAGTGETGPAADFSPSLASTAHGGFIAAPALMMDDYCAECHVDIHASWAASAHRFSSFNNPVYAFSFENTRAFLNDRDGSDEAVRFCAGCHDPVLMFSGSLLEAGPEDPESNAGITCIGCHAISAVESSRGNGDYVISEPVHYPFATARNPLLKTLNHLLIRANPAFHKETFLKPVHRRPEFCGTCHKVHIPEELNAYRWLRGQNHYDSFILSGVSGAGVNSFYYPEKALRSCADCHMQKRVSDDLAAVKDPADGNFKVHDHLMPGGHSALASQVGLDETRTERVRDMLEGSVRVDLFGLRAGGHPDGAFLGPLGSGELVVERGENYLLELVLRTVTPGHRFTEGTADSNEIWVEVIVRDGERVIAHSGKIDPVSGAVDPDAHFVNSYMVDRDGGHIALRNVEELFTAVYNHQIGPGAADTIHYELRVPADVTRALTIEAKLHYRKFSAAMVTAVTADSSRRNDLPVITIAADRAQLQLEQAVLGGVETSPANVVELWERWNDYGIGLLAKPGLGQLRQAEEAFAQVEAAGSPAGAINLARTYLRAGQLPRAASALARAHTDDRVAPPWTRAWLESELAMSSGRVDAAIALLKQIVASDFPGAGERGFDFSRDYRVWARLGQAYWLRSRLERVDTRREFRDAYLQQAQAAYQRALQLEPENVDAHYGMAQVAAGLDLPELAAQHRAQHARYRPDDSARARAVAAARAADSAVLRASNPLAVYPLEACDGGRC